MPSCGYFLNLTVALERRRRRMSEVTRREVVKTTGVAVALAATGAVPAAVAAHEVEERTAHSPVPMGEVKAAPVAREDIDKFLKQEKLQTTFRWADIKHGDCTMKG